MNVIQEMHQGACLDRRAGNSSDEERTRELRFVAKDRYMHASHGRGPSTAVPWKQKESVSQQHRAHWCCWWSFSSAGPWTCNSTKMCDNHPRFLTCYVGRLLSLIYFSGKNLVALESKVPTVPFTVYWVGSCLLNRNNSEIVSLLQNNEAKRQHTILNLPLH